MKKIIFFSLLLSATQNLSAQLVVDDTQTAQNLVQNVLVGTGVQVSNITYNGDPQAIGAFLGTSSNIGFPGGIMLASGYVTTAVGPNNSGGSGDDLGQAGDPDIDVITNNDTYDAAVLEFDFIPVSDTIKFNYVFASEEYMEYVNGGVNDGFGFFISGPGITGPFSNNSKNIAIIPGTTQYVTIDDVNEDVNGQFYFNNETPAGQSVQYDGFTTPLQAISEVQCGQTYHLKIVIADAGDGVWDSGVFLEAGSLTSTDVDFQLVSATGETEFYEACTDAIFQFTRPSDQAGVVLDLNIEVSGTATPGTDYSSFGTVVSFPVGIDTVMVPFSTFQDNINEPGGETVTITANVITECGDTVEITRSIMIYDAIQIDSLTSTPALSCAPTGATASFVSNVSGAVNYQWHGPDSPTGPLVSGSNSAANLQTGWYYMTVTDAHCTDSDSVFVDILDAPVAAFTASNTTGTFPMNVVFTNQSTNANSFEWDFGNGDSNVANDLSPQSSDYLAQGDYTVTLVAFQASCTDTAVLLIHVLTEPTLETPNIFTPGADDAVNVGWSLSPKNFKTFNFQVFNRWGNLMFEGDLNNQWWDGKAQNGKDADEGVYFYTYEGVGVNDEEKSGQGFVHIIRK